MAVFICLGLLLTLPLPSVAADCAMMTPHHGKSMDMANCPHCKDMMQNHQQQKSGGGGDMSCQSLCKAGVSASYMPVPVGNLPQVYADTPLYYVFDLPQLSQLLSGTLDRPPKALS